MLAGLACADEIRAALAEWGAAGRVLPAPPGPAGGATYRLPTDVVGEWILVDAPAGASPTVTRLTRDARDERRFDRSCSFTEGTSVEPLAAGTNTTFTDGDLRSLLAAPGSAEGLVVYVWAPHMPLSVDGHSEVSLAASSLGLALVPVLFEGSDRDFAAREARRVGIPREGLREVDSVELRMRDAQVHAPSMLAFANGRVSPVLPGYRNAEGYRRYLESFLGTTPE